MRLRQRLSQVEGEKRTLQERYSKLQNEFQMIRQDMSDQERQYNMNLLSVQHECGLAISESQKKEKSYLKRMQEMQRELKKGQGYTFEQRSRAEIELMQREFELAKENMRLEMAEMKREMACTEQRCESLKQDNLRKDQQLSELDWLREANEMLNAKLCEGQHERHRLLKKLQKSNTKVGKLRHAVHDADWEGNH
eukprot:Awhi_evm1s2993